MSRMKSDCPVFNAAQMLRFVHEDAYLKCTYAHLLKKEINNNATGTQTSPVRRGRL